MAAQRTYLAIDLKSFYASVECVDRHLDPLTTNLVVADASRTEKTICLAVSPSLKAYKIPGRARLFEAVQRVKEVNAQRLQTAIRQKKTVRGEDGKYHFASTSFDANALNADPALGLSYIVAPPRMQRYLDVSTQIYKTYLKYVSPADIYPYSIDEVFIDVTGYLPYYHMSAHELAMTMVREVLYNTGITATAGIGTNLYLAKLAMYNHYVRDGFGKLRISKIKYSDIKKFYYSLILEKGFKPNSMEIVHTLLHPTFTMAVRDGLLRLNPTEGVMAEIKKSHCWEKTKRHALTVAEQRAFTNYIANSEEYRGWFPLFTVMLGTGCRIGEVLGLRWQDVDFKNRTISINHNLVYRVQEDGTCTNHVNSPKTKAGIRIIPMIDEVFDAFLEEYQYQKVIGFCTDEIDGYSGFVFCTGDGKVYLPNAINRTIRSICADYNKEEESKAKEENRDPVLLPKFSCHILRHTFCTRFCENETNLKVIQEIMGHADISTTMDVYAEATQEKKKESMTSLQSALLVR